MNELRKHDRIQPQQQIEIFDLHTGHYYGQLADISAGGLMLISQIPIPINRIYQLRLAFSEPILGHSEICLGVDTLWTRPNASADHFWTGCCLICAAPEAEAVLLELTQKQPDTDQVQEPSK